MVQHGQLAPAQHQRKYPGAPALAGDAGCSADGASVPNNGLPTGPGERGRRAVTTVAEDVDKAQVWFDRHGAQAVLFGRLAPLVRSLVSIPAGVQRMPLGRFVAYTAVGSLLSNAALSAPGMRWAARGSRSGTTAATSTTLSCSRSVGRLPGSSRDGSDPDTCEQLLRA